MQSIARVFSRSTAAMGHARAALVSVPARNVHVEARLAELGYELPIPAAPKGSYKLCVRTNNHLFLAGHLPMALDGTLVKGKVGKDVTVEEGAKAAELVALNFLATLKAELGDLDRVVRVVKIVGFVNCVDGFAEQPQVINGCSNFLGLVLGDAGVHARSAVGTNALPLNVAVECEAIVEVE
eukprot:m.176619 g.176619  ORF g.176619 m.176619 type:complete len:182 (+) comp14207_c0_seq1:76-621(+)